MVNDAMANDAIDIILYMYIHSVCNLYITNVCNNVSYACTRDQTEIRCFRYIGCAKYLNVLFFLFFDFIEYNFSYCF